MLDRCSLTRQIKIAHLLPSSGSVQCFVNRLKQSNIFLKVPILRYFCTMGTLFIETILVTIAAVLAIVAFNNSFHSDAAWFATPGILISAAIIPTAVRKRKFAKLGFKINQIGHSLALLGWTCVVVFPPVFLGCWALRSYEFNLPLQPVLMKGQSWIGWLFYQFMYVAVAEEVFFRGYLQDNILRLTSAVIGERRTLHCWVSIVVSAACFAVAHMIIQGQIISALTFLPGLILGWLFVRTRSLLAPILFHGLANVCYFVVAAVLT
jgi:membrane protease YdiL (CAAX protease family)